MNAVDVCAWDLIGHEGEFRIKGGRAMYEAVMFNTWTKGDKVRLVRVDVTPDGLHEVSRWVDPDTVIEVVRDFDAERR